MPDRNRTRSLEEALDRHWDAILAGRRDSPADDLDPGLAATAQRVHALDAAPSPHPAFASTLWEDLMSTCTLSPTTAAQPGSPLRIHPMQSPGRWFAGKTPQPLSRLAAAILLVVLLAGSAFAALYPLRMGDHEGLSLFAPVGTPTAEPAEAAETLLLDLTLTDISEFSNEGGMAVTTYPPGGSSRELAAQTTEVLYIAAGPMTVRAEEAPEPVRVIPPGAAGAAAESRLLAGGETSTLATGTTLVAPPGAILNLVNEGSAPTTMLDLLWATASYSTEEGGALWERGRGGKRQELVLPVSIVLRQVTLEVGEMVPSPKSDEASQAAAAVDRDQRLDLVPNSDLDMVNDGDEPLALYVLTVTNNAREAMLASSAVTPDIAGVLEFLWESEGGPEPLSRPYGLGIDPQGNPWVSDASNDRFQILASDGAHLETWGVPGSGEGEFEFYSPNSAFGVPYGDVAFDAAGNLYVADTGNFRVQKFAPDRSFLLAWGEEGEEEGQFMAPSSIAIGADGVVFVSDEERADVQMFDADGRFLGVTAEAPEASLVYMPGGIAVDGDGNVWVADYLGSRILSFSPSGELLTSWGNRGMEEGEVSSPNDVAVDAMGRVFVADDGNNRVQVFTADGQFLAKAGGMGSENPTLFRDAVGVAISSDGVVYVADDPSIQAFRYVQP